MVRFFEPFFFEELPAKDVSAQQAYLTVAADTDVYQGLFGVDYGYEDAEGVSPTEREYIYATVNLLLANPVYLVGYIEQMGTGTNDVIDRCVELGLRKPEFHLDENFTVVMWRKEVIEKDNGGENVTLNGILNEKQKGVMDFITASPGVQAQVIIDQLAIPRDSLNIILKVLTDRDLIERRGSKKIGGYYIKK